MSVSPGLVSIAPVEDVFGEVGLGPSSPWTVVVWNDPVNLMSYVTYIFRSYFGYSPQQAEQLMLRVHSTGHAVVASGTRERMEVDVRAMHSFGLWATLGRGDDS